MIAVLDGNHMDTVPDKPITKPVTNRLKRCLRCSVRPGRFPRREYFFGALAQCFTWFIGGIDLRAVRAIVFVVCPRCGLFLCLVIVVEATFHIMFAIDASLFEVQPGCDKRLPSIELCYILNNIILFFARLACCKMLALTLVRIAKNRKTLLAVVLVEGQGP